MWKVIKKQLERRNTYILEKLFAFENFSIWCSRMQFEPSTGNIYALNENTLTVLRNDTQSVIDQLTESNAAPLTKCCWYDKSKLYVTANTTGEMCCWSPSMQIATRNISVKSKSESKIPISSDKSFKRCILRHSLRPHNKSVTGLAVHPVTDYVYSTSLDGYLKITNLENLTEIFSVNMGEPITHFSLMPGSFGSDYLCVMGLQSGLIRVWTSKKCSDLVATHESKLVHIAPHITPCYLSNEQSKKAVKRWRVSKELEENSEDGEDVALAMVDKELNEADADVVQGDADVDESLVEEQDDLADDDDFSSSRPQTAMYSELSRGLLHDTDEEELYLEGQVNLQFTRNSGETGFFVSQTTHNMKIWQSDGKLISIIGEDAMVDGVRSHTLSLQHKVLYCLMEDHSLRLYDLGRSIAPGTHIEEADLPIKIIPGNHFGVVDFPRCVVIVDCIPSKSGAKDGDFSGNEESLESVHETRSIDDLRQNLMAVDGGNRSNIIHDECLVIGGSIGTFRWLDPVSSLREIATTDVSTGPIGSMKYDMNRKRLFAYASSLREASNGSIFVYALPNVSLLYLIEKLEKVSHWNISMQHPHVAIGTNDGYLRLFHLLELKPESKPGFVAHKSESGDEVRSILPFGTTTEHHSSTTQDKEVAIVASGDVFEVILGDNINANDTETILPLSTSTIHTKIVTCVAFCDSLACLATSSLDKTVKIWSLDKILLQSVQFDFPVESVCFSPYHDVGDLIVTQHSTSILIKSKLLDLDVLVNAAKLLKDDWLLATLSENITEEDIHLAQLSGSANSGCVDAERVKSVDTSRKSTPAIIKPENQLPIPSSRESRCSSRDSAVSVRSTSVGSRSGLCPAYMRTPAIALNVRRPPRTEISQIRSQRLSKQLPALRPPAAENVDISNSESNIDIYDKVVDVEGNPVDVSEPQPISPDLSTKPSSSSGMRKRVAFRA